LFGKKDLGRVLRRCFAAFNKRDRKIPESRFYETHSGAREVALWISENYPEIEILIYQNLYQPDNKADGQLAFEKRDFKTRLEIIDFLNKSQISKEEIRKTIIENQ
jgi:hypothetical protein